MLRLASEIEPKTRDEMPRDAIAAAVHSRVEEGEGRFTEFHVTSVRAAHSRGPVFLAFGLIVAKPVAALSVRRRGGGEKTMRN